MNIVKQNLRKAIEIKKTMNLKYPSIETAMLAMKHNEHQFSEFLNFSKSLGVDKYFVNRIQVNPNNGASQKWLPKNKDYVYDSYLNNTKAIKACHWPWSGMVINWDGNISACCIVDDAKSDFGNIFNKSIKTVWNNESYVSSRSEFGDKKEITKQTICNVCKNDTHNLKLKRRGDSFSITL